MDLLQKTWSGITGAFTTLGNVPSNVAGTTESLFRFQQVSNRFPISWLEVIMVVIVCVVLSVVSLLDNTHFDTGALFTPPSSSTPASASVGGSGRRKR